MSSILLDISSILLGISSILYNLSGFLAVEFGYESSPEEIFVRIYQLLMFVTSKNGLNTNIKKCLLF